MVKKILKRTLFTTCLMAIAVVCIGSVSAAPVQDIRDSNVVVDIGIDKVADRLGEPINVNIAITNNGHDTTLLFPTSQLADFNITNKAGQHIYQWSYNKVFSQEITEISINQSETIELLNDSWNLVDDDGNPVTPGNYYLVGWMVKGLCDSQPEINGERLEIVVYSGPRNLKKDAICGLKAVNPVEKDVRHLINASMGFITESLMDDLWVNDTHLNPNTSVVFDAEINAVILLKGVQIGDPTIEDAVNDAINKLTMADELVVLAVIDGDTAKEYQDKAHECLSNGEPVHAIRYFKLAWMHSVAQSSQDIP
ncbi:MAG: BsuPI-related putative proteinase inhibitor [Euryarchaeota archaeon]|nr:BsuPI-related putative proteinase inhibitor [Euryarchaeota archaeon]